MGNVFAPQKTMKEIIREQKHMVDRSVRGLERDRANLARDEKNLIGEIQTHAKAGHMKSVKILAKDLVRMRKHQEKFMTLMAQLRAISMQMTSMASTSAVTDAMKKITKSMTSLNKATNMPELNKIIREFAKQNAFMETREEMIGSALDADVDEEDEQESDLIVNKVLDELGVSLAVGLVDAPRRPVPVAAAAAVPSPLSDKDLQERFDGLHGGSR